MNLGKPLIIVSHPRSGSHFLLTSILQNCKHFKTVIPFFSLETLLVPGDKTVSENFLSWYKNILNKGDVPILGTNCLREDCMEFVNKMPKDRDDVKIINHIINQGVFIYIERDPVQSLLSWYKLAKSGGAMAFSGSKTRLSKLEYKDFYELPNLHKMPHRDFQDFDTKTIKFIAYHHASWKKNLKLKNNLIVKYKDLNDKYENEIVKIFDFLKKNYNFKKWPINLNRPPYSKEARKYKALDKIQRKLGFQLNNLPFKLIIKKFFKIDLDNLDNEIISAKLASQTPTVDKNYVPNTEINDKIRTMYKKYYLDYSQ